MGGCKALVVETSREVDPPVPPVRPNRVHEVSQSLDQRDRALHAAIHGLRNQAPHHSAHIPFWWRQIVFLGLLSGGSAAFYVVASQLALSVLYVALALPFACIAVSRTIAVLLLPVTNLRKRVLPTMLSDDALPTYSILVPLYDEANMVPQIVAALATLDYPASQREVLFVLEADDRATRAAFGTLRLPDGFRVLTVPQAAPRTKPKALNFALQFARGTYVVVYDAEDLPAANQLRLAATHFARMPPDVACLQARLLIHNARDSWLTRHFSLEYMALFDGLLPAYERLGIPLPLGGTSNHFPRKVLEHLGGWDAYNVTEDADLGLRLVRLGYRARVLPCETLEEAPNTLSDWLPQRTRWLKGWMQTWLVHTRQPVRTLREMGVVAFSGFHLIFGGMILAALVHPFMYVLLIWQYLTIGPFAMPVDGTGLFVTGLTAFNLGLGYLSAVLLCALAAMRRGQAGLLFHLLTLPFYWLLVSAAAWRALWQLLVHPFKWEKTRHTLKL